MQAGSLPTYQLTFLMADYLIARQGLDHVKAYFKAFTESPDRHRNFRHALGVSLAEFEARVLDHLRTTVGLAAASALPDVSGVSHLTLCHRSERPSLADYVKLTGTKEGVTASECRSCCLLPSNFL